MKLRLISFAMLALLTFASCRDKLVGPPVTLASSDTVAYWTFDGNAHDVSTNGRNATLSGTFNYIPDRFGNAGKAVEFIGNGQMNVQNMPNFTDDDSYTVSFWVNFSAGGSLLSQGYGFGADTGEFGAVLGGCGQITSSQSPGADKWRLITVAVSAHNSATLYIDTVQVAESAYGDYTGSNDSMPLQIAFNQLASGADTTLLDNALFLHYCLSKNQVMSRFHEGGWYEHHDTVAQPPQTGSLVTGNNFVTALVEARTGLITFINAGGNGATSVPPGNALSYPDKSFLSIVADTFLTPTWDTGYYSNNNLKPTNLSLPIGGTRALPGYQWHNLSSAVTSKIGDTIETVWKNLGEDTNNTSAFDFVQDVYPVEFDASGQIVVSVKVVNHGSISHSFAAQYLNDGFISNVANDSANDNVFIINSIELVGDEWKLYQGNVPTYFAAFFEDPRQNGSTSRAIGFLSDAAAPAPMGLIPPSAVYHCEWDVAVGYGFGVANPIGQTHDMATLLQWPSVSISPSSKVEIMRTSYGTCQMPLSQMPH